MSLNTIADFNETNENGHRVAHFSGEATQGHEGGSGGGGDGQTVTLDVWTSEGLVRLTLSVLSMTLVKAPAEATKRQVLQAKPTTVTASDGTTSTGYTIDLDDVYATGD